MVLTLQPQIGALAHLVERNTGSVEVSGSSPLCSTNLAEGQTVTSSLLFVYCNLLILRRLQSLHKRAYLPKETQIGDYRGINNLILNRPRLPIWVTNLGYQNGLRRNTTKPAVFLPDCETILLSAVK